MKEEQDRILDLKEEGYSWVQIANRLGYPNIDSVRGKVRHTQRYKEIVTAQKNKPLLEITRKKTSNRKIITMTVRLVHRFE